jgi:hypothetical protein
VVEMELNLSRLRVEIVDGLSSHGVVMEWELQSSGYVLYIPVVAA